MFQIIKCRLGRHKRDSRRVTKRESGIARSVCVGCGRPMLKAYRGLSGVWQLAD